MLPAVAFDAPARDETVPRASPTPSRPVPEPDALSPPVVAKAKPGVLHSVQALRALAAYAVALFHLGMLGIGVAGVDVFFVISGFVMAKVAIDEPAARFLRKRIVRIVPLYWAVTLGFCALGLTTHLFRHFAVTPADLVRSLLFIPYVNAQGRVWPIVIPGWTLDFEMAFYGLFAIGALWRGRIGAGARVAAIVAVLFVLVVAGQIAGHALDPRSAPVLSTYTSPLLAEFAAGLVLARIGFDRRMRLHRATGPVALLLAMACWAALLLHQTTVLAAIGEQVGLRVLVYGVPAVLTVYAAIAIEACHGWPRIGALRWLGDISYSLYLTHGFVFLVTGRLTAHWTGATMLAPMVAIGMATAVAGAIHHGFERPLMRWAR